MNKVVKCKNDKCAQHFMHTEKSTKCPFCYTEYGEVIEEKTKDPSTSLGAGKKTAKTQKESFKIWKDS